ncbi:aminotransferase class V-fold PLP-dependent enzyme [bacterium]|nr:aminotransferase class V-fold PLP-dependent enzyme [bacterium]
MDPLLMIPGPTILPREVREALSQPSMYHRGEAFAELLEDCTVGLQRLFGSEQPALILTSSGTGAVEAVIVNALSPGDRVLAINGGKFGERMGQIAAAFGAEVDVLEVPPGQAANPDVVRERMSEGGYRALLFVLNETSTGVQQDAAALAEAAGHAGALSLADCVSAIAGMPIELDDAGLSAAAAGSQKALMLPPGLAFVCLSEGGWAAAEQARMPRFYTDLPRALASLRKGQTPYTPNVNMIVALQASLRLIESEGLAHFQERHRRLARACRAAARAAGLQLLAADDSASDLVTAIQSPPDMDSGTLVKALREKHNIVISGGQDALKGNIFRIGHLGAVQVSDLLRTWEAVGKELGELGHGCDVEAVLTELEDVYHGL